MYAIIDVENTGLFDFKAAADAEGQPRLAELGLLHVDENLAIEKELHFYIKPDGWEMSEETTKIHGLSHDFLVQHGVPVVEALEAYVSAIEEGRTLVAHNAQFDMKQMRAELRRAGIPDRFEETRNICTMRALTDICRIPRPTGRKGYKFPKLSEACVHFGFPVLGDHSAIEDCKACLQLLGKLIELDALPAGKVHYAKEVPVGTLESNARIEAANKGEES